MTPASSSLDGAVGTTYAYPESHTCDFYRSCQYRGNYGENCGLIVSCNTVPVHLRDVHGIVDLSRSDPVVCQWSGCGMSFSRHNIIRHIREGHLFHLR
ncbi:hypothetical protein SCLCIDRAFT_1217221 [Scleroderma citrinum Foug A]|uniref:C2H2-type domain-containing protein n=1 Tax=Scleroderma citrinum Foug A TaxID=1036808 RepID=A0A0C3DGY3_9AGAM|nr:hypothetical protein SCLCIDRAFT_1217221 [Scleroderma citrinum Foug A]